MTESAQMQSNGSDYVRKIVLLSGEADDPVTQITAQLGFPGKKDFKKQAGYWDEKLHKTFWLMYSLLYGYINKSNHHTPTHSFDAANVLNYRYDESKVKLSPNGVAKGMCHDLREEVGENLADMVKHDRSYSLAASYVVGDCIDNILARELGADGGKDLQYLTNEGDLLLSVFRRKYENIVSESLKKYGPLAKDPISRKLVIKDLDDTYNKFSVSLDELVGLYRGMITLWSRIPFIVSRSEHRYLNQKYKERIKETVRGFAKATEKRIKSRYLMDRIRLNERVHARYQEIRHIVQKGDLTDVNPVLILPSESKTFASIQKTLYDGLYLKELTDALISNAVSGKYQNGSYQELGLIKIGDAADNATRYSGLQNMMHQLRKERAILRRFGEVAKSLKEIGMEYSKLEAGLQFLLEVTRRTLNNERDGIKGRQEHQTDLKQDFGKLVLMCGLMDDFRLPLL